MALAVVMHGGAKGTERTMAERDMRPGPKGTGLGEAFMDAGRIAVGLDDPISANRWEQWSRRSDERTPTEPTCA